MAITECPNAMRPEQVSALRCDGHHKMFDLGDVGEPRHSAAESVAPVWSHQRRMVRRCLMENMMRKTNDTSRLEDQRPLGDSDRPLRDSELDAVNGGMHDSRIISKNGHSIKFLD
jgi:hypothetical protein